MVIVTAVHWAPLRVDLFPCYLLDLSVRDGQLQELAMAPLLNFHTFVNYNNLIAVLNCGESVSNYL